MKNRLEKEDLVGNRFDELAKILAGGLTRRKTLQLIGGSVLAVYLGAGRAWGAATGSCKNTCASLFNKGNMAAFDACTKACEDCKKCGGSPSFDGTLVCAGAEPCRSVGDKLTCCQGGAPCCGGVCCQPGKVCCGGMCLPGCVAGTVLDPQTCVCALLGGGPNLERCFCRDGSLIEVCAEVICDSGPDQ